MAFFDYEAAQNVAKNIIGKFAAGTINAVLRDENLGVINKVTDSYMGGGSPIDVDLICVKLDYKKNQIDEKLIKIGDILLIISVDGLAAIPTIDHKIIIETEIWNIVNIETLKPTNKILLYKLQCRK